MKGLTPHPTERVKGQIMPESDDRPNTGGGRPQPYLVPIVQDWDAEAALSLSAAENPAPKATIGDLGLATSVSGPAEFPPTMLVQPFAPGDLTGIEPSSVRVFRWDEQSSALRPVWNSGLNVEHGFVWSEVIRPGVYVPIGLPRDKVLRETLRTIWQQRTFDHADSAEGTRRMALTQLTALVESEPEQLTRLRRAAALVEFQTGSLKMDPTEIRIGPAGTLQPVPLPRDHSPEQFRERINELEIPADGLPEEALFSGAARGATPTAHLSPAAAPLAAMKEMLLPHIESVLGFTERAVATNDWPVYHHDVEHTGAASGPSDLNSTSVARLKPRSKLSLDGPVISIPSVVQGKVYVGTGNSRTAQNSSGGTLYKIDLATATVEKSFTFNTPRMEGPPGQQNPGGSNQGYAGIGGSPAVVADRVYFSGLNGKLYCLDAGTLQPVWITDLRHADPAHNQPVTHTVNAEGWSSPLVVNGRVYVGFGEGESGTFGFVYCLDAADGKVIWLFCTNQFVAGVDNRPNVIPASLATGTLPAGFTRQPDPPQVGVSVWSSCAYDSALNRIYFGTGNSTAADDTPLPDFLYGSGVMALDAMSGEFRGYFQPDVTDSYRPTDLDVDIPAAPVLFTRDGARVLAIGSKNGSFFLLDPDTMNVLARRQLLPHDRDGQPFPNIDVDIPGENKWGVFGTAAVHAGLGRLFVGIGGYSNSIDSATTPFMRVLDWNTLNDAWVTRGDNPPKYVAPVPPMYTTAGETGLTSPAVVNDVVFIGTSKPGFYALAANTGLLLWSAKDLGQPGSRTFIMGPAVCGNDVIVGEANSGNSGTLHIYSL
jgi:outer membrane protein assembly factor BamB